MVLQRQRLSVVNIENI